MVTGEVRGRDDDASVAELEAEALAEIRRILAADLEVPRSVAPGDALVGDLHVDSVGALILAVGLEDHFRVALDDADAVRVVTVADLARLVARRVWEEHRGGAASPPGDGPMP